MNFAWAPDNEWDYIPNFTGDASWNHEHMRRHFIDVENCTYVPHGTPGHGFDGYIQVLNPTPTLSIPTNKAQSSHVNQTRALAPPNVARYVQQIFAESGDVVPENIEHMVELFDRDVNRLDADRYATPLVFVLPEAIHSGNRSSIANHINDAILAGYPLTLSLQSLATRILFDEQLNGKPRTVGVEYLKGEGLYSADSRYDSTQTGELRTVKAKREIIVSGGTFNTPQILKLSGIGSREELEALDIPVVVDLPAVVSLWTNRVRCLRI
jgi:choline dehydrogenase